MKRLFIFILIAAAIIGAGAAYRFFAESKLSEKVYVAAEGDGKVIVVDPATRRVIAEIDLSMQHEGGILPYAPHNIQVSPDMQTVWVTANTGMHQEHSSIVPSAFAHSETGSGTDAVIIIDPTTDTIRERIPIGTGIHLAHVVLTPDSAYAYATAQSEGVIYKINARTFVVEGEVPVPAASGIPSEPHGIRISPDGRRAYIALLGAKALGVLDIATGVIRNIPLGGAAVQTGVTPDGAMVVASLYDTKELLVFNTVTEEQIHIPLPEGAKGPIQMYATPDSRFVYLADQGYYFDQPMNDKVFKIDLQSRTVAKTVVAGRAPHGVVVSGDGKYVYVTNLLSGDLSVIETATDAELYRIPVGREPNGVSIWENRK